MHGKENSKNYFPCIPRRKEGYEQAYDKKGNGWVQKDLNTVFMRVKGNKFEQHSYYCEEEKP